MQNSWEFVESFDEVPCNPHHPFVEAKILACCGETHEQQQQQHQQEDLKITNM
jgi:hypothetical protein